MFRLPGGRVLGGSVLRLVSIAEHVLRGPGGWAPWISCARVILWLFVSLVVSAPAWGGMTQVPVAVSFLQSDGKVVQLRLRVPGGQEPVLEWSGTSKPAPYSLSLAWADTQFSLVRPLPDWYSESSGSIQTLEIKQVSEGARLEMSLSQPVEPRLRRVGDSWILRLDVVSPESSSFAPPVAARDQGTLAAVRAEGSTGASNAPIAPPSLVSRPASPSLSRAPQSSGHTHVHSDRSQVRPEALLLEMTFNGQRIKDIALAEKVPEGPLLLPVEVWKEARLTPLEKLDALSDGTPAYALEAVAGAKYSIDRENLKLEVNAPATAFMREAMTVDLGRGAPLERPEPGAVLNYDFSASEGGSGRPLSSGAMLELVAFNGFGNIVNSVLVRGDGSGRSATRLDSFWRYDMPNRLETLVVGDTVGVGGGWSRPVRFGGIRWGRDFSMRPGFVTLPQLSLSGEASLPSTVDVLVNNTRRLSRQVQPGPFDLTNLPIVSGSGEVSLLVRDLLGRETVVRQNFYASPRLLAPGLTDFSFEAGKLRAGYGLESTYGDAFAAATWREGLSNRLTGEARLEWQANRRAAGLELAGLLGQWGVGRLAFATSIGGHQGLEERGQMFLAGIERSTPRGGGSIQYEYASSGFSPLGEARSSSAVVQRFRERWLANLGGPIWRQLSGGLSFVRQTRWDGERFSSVGLSLSTPLWPRANLNISLTKRLDGDQGWLAGLSINMPLEGGTHVATRLDRSADGQVVGSVAASRPPPAGPGIGWRLEASSLKGQRARAGLQGNMDQAEWSVDLARNAQGQVDARLGARGSLGWLAGMPFASRPVGQGSFAVVQVADIEGVPVKRSHQVVAKTNAKGLAFVPGLLPWQKNQIEIDPVDLPLSAEVSESTLVVTPYARGGSVVKFDVRTSRQALVILHQVDGTPVPMGARVHSASEGLEYIAGRRGEVWLNELTTEVQRLEVRWQGGSCSMTIKVPISADGAPVKIGPLQCGEGLK